MDKAAKAGRVLARRGDSIASAEGKLGEGRSEEILLGQVALAIARSSGPRNASRAGLAAIARYVGRSYVELWAHSTAVGELELVAAAPTGGRRHSAMRAAAARLSRHARVVSFARLDALGPACWSGSRWRASDDRLLRWGTGVRAGLARVASVPIRSEGTTLGVLLLFQRAAACEVPDDCPCTAWLHEVEVASLAFGACIRRMLAERELAAHRTELERLVAARTADLRRSQLQLGLAERLASIGTLAAGLGHDLNNVLMPVRAHLNALRASIARGEMRIGESRHIEAIRKSVAYLQQLADGMHFLAMDPDRVPPGSADAATDLEQWWSQVGPLLASAVPKHVRVDSAIEPDLPPIALAAPALTQAALNLIVNAGEAIPTGRRGSRVVVWAKRAREKRTVTFGVTDNGIGMSTAVKRRVFELFFTTKPRGLGTGLGLPMVLRVAERAGGSVSVESAVGKGTTIAIRIPIARLAGRGGQGRWKARVRVADGRAGALLRHMLSSAGVSLASERESANAAVWVVDPQVVDVVAAKRWRSRFPKGRLVLFGAPLPGDADAWRGLGATTIGRPADLDALRVGLERAIATGR